MYVIVHVCIHKFTSLWWHCQERLLSFILVNLSKQLQEIDVVCTVAFLKEYTCAQLWFSRRGQSKGQFTRDLHSVAAFIFVILLTIGAAKVRLSVISVNIHANKFLVITYLTLVSALLLLRELDHSTSCLLGVPLAIEWLTIGVTTAIFMVYT